jgi:hypothetical protein
MNRTKKTVLLTAITVVVLAGAIAVSFASRPDPAEPTENAPPDPPKVPEKWAPPSAVVVAQGPGGPRIIAFRTAEQIAALEKYFPDYRRRPASFAVSGGWEACYEIYFNFPQGNTVRLTAPAEGEAPCWSAGRGDFPLDRGFYKLVAAAGNLDASTGTGDWSAAVNGLKARLVLERGAAVNGTPIIKAYVELYNVSESAKPIEVQLGNTRWTWAVTDRDGNDVRHTSLPGNELAGPPPRLVIPNGATLRLVVSKSASGIPKEKAAHLDLGLERTWVFERGDRKDYFLRGKMEVAGNTAESPWGGTLDLPKVRIPLAGR